MKVKNSLTTADYLYDVIKALLVVAISTNCHASCPTRPLVAWRADGRCGRGFYAPDTSQPAQCNPQSDRPCCSDYGYCGNSRSHCRCSACVDFRSTFPSPYSPLPSPETLFSSPTPFYFLKYLPPPPVTYYLFVKPACHFSFENETGYLESPNYPEAYPSDQDCCYDIMRPSQEYCGVSLLVEGLDVGSSEEEGFCQRDWLSLPSCVPEKGTRICGNATGQYLQYLYQPGASAIRFEFHAGNQTTNSTGFKIRYEILKTCPGPYQTQDPPISPIPGTTGDVPCYTRITDARGTINTPFYPDPYANNLDCIYEFIRTSASVCGVRMESVRFEMEDPFTTPFGGACTDFFHLPSCGFLCGQVAFEWLVEFQPNATSFKFHFHTNHNASTVVPSKPGFLINFQQLTSC